MDDVLDGGFKFLTKREKVVIFGNEAVDDLFDTVMLLEHGHVKDPALVWVFSLQEDGKTAEEGPFVTGLAGKKPPRVKIVDENSVFEDVIVGPSLEFVLGQSSWL